MIKKRLEELLILRLIVLGDRLKRRRDIISKTLGISTQQWLIMLHLALDPNLPYFEKKEHKKPLLASELAEALNVTRPNITNMLNSLIEKGLVEQVDDEDDKRRKRLSLSPQGLDLLQSLQPHRERLNAALFEDLTTEQKQMFLDITVHFTQVLEQQLDKGYKIDPVVVDGR